MSMAIANILDWYKRLPNTRAESASIGRDC